MVKKHSERKPRIQQLGLAFGQTQTISGMQSNGDGSFTLFGEDGKPLSVPSGYASLVYERPQGPKVTVQVPDRGDAIGSVSRAIDSFSRIVGVDTNSIDHGGKRACVTTVVEILGKVHYNAGRWTVESNPLWAFEFYDPLEDPERIGWMNAIRIGARHHGWLSADPDVLLVVDSHLRDLHQINRRKLPLVGNEFLPVGVSLAYASADTTDSALNGLIRHCDRLASAALEQVTKLTASSMNPLLQQAGTPFGEYRYGKLARRKKPLTKRATMRRPGFWKR